MCGKCFPSLVIKEWCIKTMKSHWTPIKLAKIFKKKIIVSIADVGIAEGVLSNIADILG